MYNKTILILLLAVAPVGLGRRTLTLNNQPSDFAIYLLKDDTLQIWQVKGLSLSALDLANRPLVGISDIESYQWSDHSIRLTIAGIAKFKALEDKTNSTSGFPFVVVVGNERVYLGNIYRMHSSYMPGDLPLIFAPIVRTLKIGRALDRSIEDKRNDLRVYKELARRNKLAS